MDLQFFISGNAGGKVLTGVGIASFAFFVTGLPAKLPKDGAVVKGLIIQPVTGPSAITPPGFTDKGQFAGNDLPAPLI